MFFYFFKIGPVKKKCIAWCAETFKFKILKCTYMSLWLIHRSFIVKNNNGDEMNRDCRILITFLSFLQIFSRLR
jgi:hypothetical protein